ncbi:MAG: phosphoribosylanthranilate isomerase [Gammaproteobacteria bacterium]|nr:phosphoribosylanthranilate isomerase [Gammaproteobacteria bacterium]
MNLLVKICGLSDERHVVTAVEAGAGALGFVFAESVRKVTPEVAKSISDAVPRDVKRVAVMLHPANDDWLAVLETFEPDVLQTDADDYDGLEIPASVERWPVFREGRPVSDVSGIYVYEGPTSGRGETVDWSAAAELARSGQIILAGGLGPDNVATAIQIVEPFGVDVSSGVESAPGQKDSRLIREFISAAKAAEKMP